MRHLSVVNFHDFWYHKTIGTPQRILSADDVILADQSQSNHSQEDDTFAEDSVGQSSGVIHQLRRPRLVSESEDYTNVSYDLYAMSVRSLLIY